jgi:N-acetyl-beta-hexosaminidase
MVSRMSDKQTNKAIKQASLESLNEAGFKTPMLNKDGKVNKQAKKKAQEMLKLPPVQNLMTQKFEEHGLTTEKRIPALSMPL